MLRSVLLVFFLLLLTACEDTNIPMMTDAAADAVKAITLDDASVSRLARLAAEDADGKHRVAPPDHPYDIRLRRLTAAHGAVEGRNFSYKAYLTKEVNAFALADGSIRVYGGLMDLMNDRELLFVLGHEIGHVVKEHVRKKVVMAYAASAVKKGLAAQENEVGTIAGSLIGAFGEQLVNAQFSQHEERQADSFGVAFLQAVGHDATAAITALHKLADLARQHTFLSSHPDPEARAKRLLQGKVSDEEDSLASQILAFAKEAIRKLLNLIGAIIAWLLSLF